MLSRRKENPEDDSRCHPIPPNSKSWMFHKFPVRYTSPRMQHARTRYRRDDSKDVRALGVPKVSVQFDINAKFNRSERKSIDGATQESAPRPLLQSFSIEKYELQERFKVVEIHRKVCKHCKYENFFCKSSHNLNHSLVKKRIDMLNKELQGSDWTNSSLPSSNQEYLDSEAMSLQEPLKHGKTKQKIVVEMPKVDLCIEESGESRTSRPLLSYTHRK